MRSSHSSAAALIQLHQSFTRRLFASFRLLSEESPLLFFTSTKSFLLSLIDSINPAHPPSHSVSLSPLSASTPSKLAFQSFHDALLLSLNGRAAFSGYFDSLSFLLHNYPLFPSLVG